MRRRQQWQPGRGPQGKWTDQPHKATRAGAGAATWPEWRRTDCIPACTDHVIRMYICTLRSATCGPPCWGPWDGPHQRGTDKATINFVSRQTMPLSPVVTCCHLSILSSLCCPPTTWRPPPPPCRLQWQAFHSPFHSSPHHLPVGSLMSQVRVGKSGENDTANDTATTVKANSSGHRRPPKTRRDFFVPNPENAAGAVRLRDPEPVMYSCEEGWHQLHVVAIFTNHPTQLLHACPPWVRVQLGALSQLWQMRSDKQLPCAPVLGVTSRPPTD